MVEGTFSCTCVDCVPVAGGKLLRWLVCRCRREGAPYLGAGKALAGQSLRRAVGRADPADERQNFGIGELWLMGRFRHAEIGKPPMSMTTVAKGKTTVALEHRAWANSSSPNG